MIANYIALFFVAIFFKVIFTDNATKNVAFTFFGICIFLQFAICFVANCKNFHQK